MYRLAVAYVDKKLSAFESLQFSHFSPFLGKSLQKFYTGFVKENIPKNETQKKVSIKFFWGTIFEKCFEGNVEITLFFRFPMILPSQEFFLPKQIKILKFWRGLYKFWQRGLKELVMSRTQVKNFGLVFCLTTIFTQPLIWLK